ncbi:uncharacterized protein AAES06_008557 [Glossophaga mutica]
MDGWTNTQMSEWRKKEDCLAGQTPSGPLHSPLLFSRSGCAASHDAVQERMAQHQDRRQCQPQVRAFRDCMSEQQARRREELQRRKEQGSVHS